MKSRLLHRLSALAAVAVSLLGSPPTLAGGGPESTLIVANSDSQLSLRVANEYLALRDIPATNLVRLSDIPFTRTITIEEFREKILKPVFAFLTRHELDESIDTIAYSVSFPYAVDFSQEIRARMKGVPRSESRLVGRHASLTGLTFFAHRVAAGDLGYLGANHYFRRNLSRSGCIPGREFDQADRKAYDGAIRAFNKADLPAAESAMEMLLVKYPDNARIWFSVARIRAAGGRDRDALDALEQAASRCFADVLETSRDRNLRGLAASPRFGEILDKMGANMGPFQGATGFRSRYIWARRSNLFLVPAAQSLDRYFLSVFLGYSGVRGNSVPEIVDYLNRSAKVDGTRPIGSVYLMLNDNIRSEVRWPLFPETIRQIRKRGGNAEIIERAGKRQDGIIPKNRTDIVGLTAGTSRFDWGKSGSAMLPGAIAESLTSYAGHFEKAKQTKLSAFLRHGAAGSSGAVAEPYSINAKFPLPLIHVHYADGSSLAEAFFQSIEAPYQLLVVGDPLARPFAAFAQVDFEVDQAVGLPGREVSIEPSVIPSDGRGIGGLEVWVDGRRVKEALTSEDLSWSPKDGLAGWREIRLVAYDDTPIETRSYTKKAYRQGSEACHLVVTPLPSEWNWDQPLRVTGLASVGSQVEILSGHHRLATVDSPTGAWETSVFGRETGLGPVELRAMERKIDGSTCLSRPASVRFRIPESLAQQPSAEPTEDFDATLTYRDGTTEKKQIDSLSGRFRDFRGESGTPMRLQASGAFQVRAAGFYEIVVDATGDVSLSLGKQRPVSKTIAAGDGPLIVNVSLKPGWHALDLDVQPIRGGSFRVLLTGETVARVVGE